MAMYNLMIIDDEILIRKYLKKIINDNIPECTIIGEAENADEAIEKISELKPDIIITDICLNQDNGLDIFTLLPHNAKIIVITGYRNFEYAQQALSLKVSALILKPINPDELVTTIRKTINELEQENKRNRFIDSNMPYIKQKFLLDMIYGVYLENTEKASELSQELSISIKDHFLILCKLYFTSDVNDDEKYSLTDKYLQSLMCLEHDENIQIYHIHAGYDKIFLILEDVNKIYSNEQLYDLCNNMHMPSKSFSNKISGLSISISSKGPNLYSLNNEYQECVLALSARRSNYDIIFYSDVMINSFVSNELSSKVLEQLKNSVIEAIQENNILEIQSLLYNSLDIIKEIEKNNRDSIIEFYTQLFLSLHKICSTNAHSFISDNFTKIYNLKNNIANCKSIELLNELLIQMLDNAPKKTDTPNNTNVSSHVKAALEYIHESYSENISLNDVAKHIHVSSVHTGRLFKKEVGCTITDYINEYRIKKAKEFLDSGNYKIYEVAEKVGINSTNYFITLFKKHTGYIPSEYIKNSKL